MSAIFRPFESLTEAQRIIKINSFINLRFLVMTLLYAHNRAKRNGPNEE